MKNHLKLRSLALMASVLFCSGIAGISILSKDPLSAGSSAVQDTSGLIRFVRINPFHLPIIPPSSGVGFFKDKIIFLSQSKNERKMPPDHVSFGDAEAYYASIEDSVTGSHMIFSRGSLFSYPCESMTFSRGYDTIYFSKPDREYNKEKIFMAKSGTNEKGQPVLSKESSALEFCTGNSNYSHPALSYNGDIMIFASDRPGSLGGMDLYITRRSGGSWSAPENLGNLINTTGNEFFPFLDNENNLFFSSDKLPGFGGYDVFSCRYNGSGWEKPVNLTDRINSIMDDVAFTAGKDGTTAFFTRKTGENNMQLFRVSLDREAPGHNLLAVFNASHIIPKTLIATDTLRVTQQAAAKPVSTEPLATVKPKEAEVNTGTVSGTGPVKLPANAVIISPTRPLASDQKALVIYRVQILASTKQKKEKEITINAKRYELYEYYYLNAYRYSIGEFKSPEPAKELQKLCRQSGYPQAFTAAFKDNIRSTDLKSFK
jgi:hypothetical protein